MNGSNTRSKDPIHRVAGLAVNCPLWARRLLRPSPEGGLLLRGRAVQLYCVYTIQLDWIPAVSGYIVYIVQFVQCVHCIAVNTMYIVQSVH